MRFPTLILAAVLPGLPAPKDPPRLRVEPPGQVDLGSLGPREVRRQVYRILNTSPGPISLRVLDLSPGVTVEGPALEGPIAGGAAAALALRWDPSGWQGDQARNVRLETDDPHQGTYYLPVRGVIRPDLSVDGDRRDFGDVADHESPREVFRFARETGEPLSLRVVSGLPPYLDCEADPQGGRTELAFILRPARVPPGALLGLERLRVETNVPLQPAFVLYLAWRIHHAVNAEPPRVVFQDWEGTSLDLRLASRDGAPFRILEARVEGDGFATGPLPRPGSAQVLTIHRNAKAPGRAMLCLTFEGVERELKVPLGFLPASGAPVRSSAPGKPPAGEAPAPGSP